MSTTLHEIIGMAAFPQGEAWNYVDYEAGDTVITEGEVSRDVYLVVEGSAMVSKRVDLEGRQAIRSGIGELGPDDVFGELGLYASMPRSASIIASSPMRIIRIDGEALVRFMEQHPDLGYRFLREVFMHMAGLLHKADSRMAKLFSWGLRAHRIDEHL